MGAGAAAGVARVGPHGGHSFSGVGTDVRPYGLLRRNVHRSHPLPWHLLSRRQLEVSGIDHGARQKRPHLQAEPPDQGSTGIAPDTAFPGVADPVMRSSLPRIEVNLEEIYQILDAARRQPMSETDYEKVKTAVEVLAEKAVPPSRSTEKTRAVLPNQNPNKPAEKEPAEKGKLGEAGTWAQRRLWVHGREPGHRRACHAPAW